MNQESIRAGQPAVSIFSRYWTKLQRKGLSEIIRDRLRWYRVRFEMDNWVVGKAVELTGNRIRLHGLTFNVDNPLVSTRHKSTLFFGRYEVDELELARQLLDSALPLVELGGSIGVVACVTNRLLQDPKRHVVVEASPVLLPTLESNRALNNCQFTIEHAALAYGTDAIEFPVEGHFLHGRMGGSAKTARVQAVTLAQLLAKHTFETFNLIVDIEGAEIDLVENEPDLLRERVKLLVMETHAGYRGEAQVKAMLETLTELGFEQVQPRAADKGAVVAVINRSL